MNKPISRRDALTTGGLTLLGTTALGRPDHPLPPPPAATGRFVNRVVLITGATSGIGEGTAHAFAREGAKVFFCGRREALGRQVEAAIRRAGGEATYRRADVRQEADVRALISGCLERYGRLDIAFNNAGIETPKPASIADQPLEDWLDVLTTNATGTFLSLKYELPHLLHNEPWGAFGTRGVVINTASTSGITGFAGISPYSASKHAIIGLTKCAALEYSPLGVRINSIAPGGVDTPMRHRAYAGQRSPGQPDPPAPNLYHRTNTVTEMADVVLFLASDAGSAITGTNMDVTGGFHTGAHLTMVPTNNPLTDKK